MQADVRQYMTCGILQNPFPTSGIWITFVTTVVVAPSGKKEIVPYLISLQA